MRVRGLGVGVCVDECHTGALGYKIRCPDMSMSVVDSMSVPVSECRRIAAIVAASVCPVCGIARTTHKKGEVPEGAERSRWHGRPLLSALSPMRAAILKIPILSQASRGVCELGI